MMQRVGIYLGLVCRCLETGPLLDLLIITHATNSRAERIYIEERVDPGTNIKHFRQAMGVEVIYLVEVLQFLGKLCVLEPLVRIMAMVIMKGQCMYLHCRAEHG